MSDTMLNALINGKVETTLPITDRGLQYGDGVFETLAVINGKPQHWDRHIARLQRGCGALQLTCPDAALLAAEAQQMIGNHDRAVLKIIITRGSGGRGYAPPQPATPTRLVQLHAYPDYSAQQAGQGVRVRIAGTRLASGHPLAGHKHLNRLEQVLARSEPQAADYFESLLLDHEDNLICGSMSNVFCVLDGNLYTPDVSRAGVAGILRELVLQQAGKIKLSAQAATLPLQIFSQAQEIFISNSLFGILPVVSVQSTQIQFSKLSPLPGNITRVLQAHLSTQDCLPIPVPLAGG